jgi:hypothetical protein
MEATVALDKPGYYPGDILRCAIKASQQQQQQGGLLAALAASMAACFGG